MPKIEVDIKILRSMFITSQGDIRAAEILKNTGSINSILKLYYDVLHVLADILLRFDQFESTNHICIFAYVCKNPDLDWNFFERIRTVRNGICYHGTPVKEEEWKRLELQAQLHIQALTQMVEDKINNFLANI
ncbi:MAG: hypothetical protein KKG59_04915 [Nanoarchaeota archaeon]|nr:hypothetical protein [Nanoarchaeota archaeon]